MIKPFCYDDTHLSLVSSDFDRIEIEQKLIKKVDISVILDMKKHNTFGKSSTTP